MSYSDGWASEARPQRADGATLQAPTMRLGSAAAADEDQRGAGRFGCGVPRGCLENASGASCCGVGFLLCVLRFHGVGQQVSLHADRAAMREEFQLRGTLDTLGNNLQSEA